MNFKKYASIENSYREKHIQETLESTDYDMNLSCVAQEKIHGANISFHFKRDNDNYKVASRNRILENGEQFYDVWNVINDNLDLIALLQEVASDCFEQSYYIQEVHFYGELFGGGIQKGVDYGKEKRILIYDVSLTSQSTTYLTPALIPDKLKQSKHFIPYHATGTLEDLLQFDVESFQTQYGNGAAEGIVIKPYNKIIVDKNGNPFYLKRKAEKFLEASKAPKRKRKPVDKEWKHWCEVFETYITTNRLQNVFSKHGRIEDKSQVGKYVQLLTEDAKEDFLKDYPDYDDSVNKQTIFKSKQAGKIIVKEV